VRQGSVTLLCKSLRGVCASNIREGGWKPVKTRRARIRKLMLVATLSTLFQTVVGVLSGPGAQEGEHLVRALEIWGSDSSGASLKGRMIVS